MIKHIVDRAQLAVAVHEGGHAVAGFIHGREIERVRLLDGDPAHAGSCEFAQHPGGVPPVAVYAGTAAELRFTLGRRPSGVTHRAAAGFQREKYQFGARPSHVHQMSSSSSFNAEKQVSSSLLSLRSATGQVPSTA